MMAVFTKKQFDKKEVPTQYLETDVCFMCGGDFFDDAQHSTGAIVVWVGTTGHLCLHQSCAEKLGVNLLQDARSLATIVGKRSKLCHETPTDDPSWYTKLR